MPLIKCPDCNTSVSDKANACIKCGYPISELENENQIDSELMQISLELKDETNLQIGRQIMNWTGGAVLKNAVVDLEQGQLGSLGSGKIELYIHKGGVRLRNSLFAGNFYDVHFKQIMDITEVNAEELVHEQKSVIGRGIAGGVLLGPAAAIVGALSAMKSTSLKKLTIVHLSFFDSDNSCRRDVFFRVPRGSSALFVAKVQKAVSDVRPKYYTKYLERSIAYVETLSPKHAAKMRIELEQRRSEGK